MAVSPVKGGGGTQSGTATTGGVANTISSSAGSLSLDQFIQVSVAAAAKATKDLPGGPHPIWIGIIIRPPDVDVIGKTNK